MSGEQSEDVPVVIVGAGPVGLSAALFLTRQGIRPVVLERHDGTSVAPRATGVHVRTLELYRVAGVEREIREVGQELVVPGDPGAPARSNRALPRVILRATTLADLDNAIILETPDTEPSAISATEPGAISPCPPIWCGQDIYEPILAATARRGGADLRFGTRMTSFSQDGEGVTVHTEDGATGQVSRLRARYLIAADGVRSGVREQLGITRSGHGSAGHAMSILFHADLDPVLHGRRFIICYLANQQAPGVLVSLDGRERWVLAVRFQPERGEAAADFTPERCVAAVRAAAGRPDLDIDIKVAYPWESAHWVADSYRSGRVFLAGDAAHVHPPAGGFGANAGVQDAHNLAWKLGAVLNGWADARLLDSYEAERRPVGLATADQAYLRDGARAHQAGGGQIREYLSVILGYRYSSSAVIGAEPGDAVPRDLRLDGRPGTRAPHVWLRRDGEQISAIDLFDDSFVLLAGRQAGAWADGAVTAAARAGLPLRAYRVVNPAGGTPVPANGSELLDIHGDWNAAYGVTATGASLIRPDGFVAWRAVTADPVAARTLSQVLSQITGHDHENAGHENAGHENTGGVHAGR